jgi:hypothetical protein
MPLKARQQAARTGFARAAMLKSASALCRRTVGTPKQVAESSNFRGLLIPRSQVRSLSGPLRISLLIKRNTPNLGVGLVDEKSLSATQRATSLENELSNKGGRPREISHQG